MKPLTEAKTYLMDRSLSKLHIAEAESADKEAQENYRMLKVKVEVYKNHGFDTSQYDGILAELAKRYEPKKEKIAIPLPIEKEDAECIDELLADVTFYSKMQDKTEYQRTLNELGSIMFALKRLGYATGKYARKIAQIGRLG